MVGIDQLFGDEGDDYLFGDAYNAAAGVQGGNDTLHPGTGNDHMWGGRGADTFDFNVYQNGVKILDVGHDTIYDFDPMGGDTIDILAFQLGSFANLNLHDNTNGDAVLRLGDNASITFIGVHTTQFSASDFWTF